jgi:hypothetical protein
MAPPPFKGQKPKKPAHHGARGAESQRKRDEKQENRREQMNIQTDTATIEGIREKLTSTSLEGAIFNKMQIEDASYMDSREKNGALLVCTNGISTIIKKILRQHSRLIISKQLREHDFVATQIAWIAVTCYQLSYKFFELHRNYGTNGRVAYHMTSEEKCLVAGNRANLAPIVEFIDSIGPIDVNGQRLIPFPWATSDISMNFTTSTLRKHIQNQDAAIAAHLVDSCFNGIEVWNPHAQGGVWEVVLPQQLAQITPDVIPLYYKFIGGMQSATGYPILSVNWNTNGCESMLPTYDFRFPDQTDEIQIWHQEKVNPVNRLKGAIMGYGSLPPKRKRPTFGMPPTKMRKLAESSGIQVAQDDDEDAPYDQQDILFALPWRLPDDTNVRFSSRTRYNVARDKWLHGRKTGLV